jgi:hypothetical protein
MKMQCGATFSKDRRYRYKLFRSWDERLPPLIVIMLNPSIADAKRLDNTCAGVLKRAMRTTHGSMIVLNVGAGIATQPRDWHRMEDKIGPHNLRFIREVLEDGKERNATVVAGWGTHARPHEVRPILDILDELKLDLYCFDKTDRGHPKHPLYVRHDKPFEMYRRQSQQARIGRSR